MLQDLLTSRYFIGELLVRDIRTRYTGSVLGLFWSILNPVMQLLLYTLVFSVFLGVRLGAETGAGGFAEYLFCALLPWSAIQESTTRSARGFLDHGNLIKKIHFPLVTIPASLVGSALIHQMIATLVFLIVVTATGSIDLWTLPLLLPLLAIQAAFMYGSALIIATLNVFFKDISQIIGVFFLFLFWLTPIVYPKSAVPEKWSLFLDLNPLTHLVEAYRYAVFAQSPPSLAGLAYWILISVTLILLGSFILSKSRSVLLDLV